MNTFLIPLLQNKILWVSVTGWAIGQSIKVIIGIFKEKRFNFRWFVGTGGMPSSHAAGATALAVACGFDAGFNSAVFALAVMFAIVTMFDAQGVRRSTGQQAELLNKILDDIYFKGKIEEDRLKELIGHTPVEVFIGAIIGFAIALVAYR